LLCWRYVDVEKTTGVMITASAPPPRLLFEK
jgi:hypothetical protein